MDYKKLIVSTASSIVQLAASQKKLDLSTLSNLKIVLKDGTDGAGGQELWCNSKSMNDNTETILY